MRETISDSLNETSTEIQKKERSHVKANFIVRKEQFTMRQAAIIKFAKPTFLQAKVYVGKKKRHFLYEFERGGSRLAQRELRRLGVPGVGVPRAARPTPQSIVAEQDWIANLQLMKAKQGTRVKKAPQQGQNINRIWRVMRTAATIAAGGTGQTLKGNRGTFLIPGYGIYQRINKQVKKLYLLTTRPVRLPAKLRFIETAKAVATKFNGILSRRIGQAFRHDFSGRSTP